MIEQAGTYKIVLYENVGISLNYPFIDDNTKIDSISNTGEQITLNSCNVPQFEYTANIGANNAIVYEYELTFKLFDYNLSTLDTIINISEKLTGWSALIYFNNGDIRYLNACLFQDAEIEEDTNTGNAYIIQMTNRVPTTEKLKELIETPPIGDITVDSTIITVDSTLITVDNN